MKRIAAWLGMRHVGSGTAIVFLLASLMAIAGASAQWVWLPLSAPVAGADIEWLSVQLNDGGVFSISYGEVLTITLAAAAVLAWFGFRYLAFFTLVVAFAILVYFPVRLIFIDVHWIEMYVAESTERSGLKRFFRAFVLPPNRGGEFAYVDVRAVEYLGERVAVASYVVGWGWALSMVGCVLMMIIVRLTGAPPHWLLLPGSLLATVTVIVAVFGADEMTAEYAHRQGDRAMGVGAYEQALAAYELALRRDPALMLSMPLALKVSKAHYQLLGEHHYYSQLYLAEQDLSRRRFNEAALRLALSETPPAAFFTDYLQSKMYTKRLEVMLEFGLIQYINGELARARMHIQSALALQPRSIRGRTYLARQYYDLRDYANSLLLLNQLVEDVYHPSFRADFYSSKGDALTALGKLPQAREAYQESLNLDSKDNFRAIKGLSGT